jgi:hypothetical protein
MKLPNFATRGQVERLRDTSGMNHRRLHFRERDLAREVWRVFGVDGGRRDAGHDRSGPSIRPEQMPDKATTEPAN